MAWKIFNIAKANARIEELETENTQLKQQVDELGKNDSEALAAAQGELTETKEKLTQATSDLATAKTSIESLTKEKESLASQVTKLTNDLQAKDKEVETKAAQKALEITASQGQPPIESKPTAEPAKPQDSKAELKGLDKVRASIREQIKNIK